VTTLKSLTLPSVRVAILHEDATDDRSDFLQRIAPIPSFATGSRAPDFRKKKNLRLMVAKDGIGADALQEIRSVVGGILVQIATARWAR